MTYTLARLKGIKLWQTLKVDKLHMKHLFSFHICASDSNNAKDSCQGDSGGPLMISENGR